MNTNQIVQLGDRVWDETCKIWWSTPEEQFMHIFTRLLVTEITGIVLNDILAAVTSPHATGSTGPSDADIRLANIIRARLESV